MDIVQVLLSPRIGGAESLAMSLSNHWTSVGVQNELVYLDPNNDLGRIARARRLRSLLQESGADYILAHSALPNLYARAVAPVDVPVVAVLHSARDDFSLTRHQIVERLLLARHNRVVAVSQLQAERYLSHFPKAKVSVIPNGVKASENAAPSRMVPDRAVVVTLARVADQKNPRLWMQVADELGREGVALAWWGPIEDDRLADAATVRAYARQWPARLPGASNEPTTILSSADVYFHPADREAFSVSILEAAAAGLPIVCSAEVAATLPQELRVNTFDTSVESSASATLRSVLSDLPAERVLAAANSQFVREHLSLEATAMTYLRLFRE